MTDSQAPSGYAARVPAEERRSAILDAALESFALGGVAAVTMEGLARRVGVSKPVVYRHFSNVDDVMRELLRREATAAVATAIAQLPADADYTDPLTATPAALIGLLDEVRAHPTRWRLILDAERSSDSETLELIEETRSFAVQQLAHLAALAFVERSGGDLDTELTAYLIWAGLLEGVRLVLWNPARYPRDRMVRFANELVRTILQG